MSEEQLAGMIADLELIAWQAIDSGREELAEETACQLASLRVEYADTIGVCD